MGAVISLAEIVASLEMAGPDVEQFLNRETGEILAMSDQDVSLVEDEVSSEGRADRQVELRKEFQEVLNSDRWLKLPDSFDIHEWSIMERFSRSIEDENHREQLLDAIHGTGAFRMFRSTVERLGIRESWFQYRRAALEHIARDWLDSEGIRYK